MTYEDFVKKWQGEPGSFPRIVKAADYHEFGQIENILENFTGQRVMCREIGMHGGSYVGVICEMGKTVVLDLVEEDFRYNLDADAPRFE